MNPVANQRVSPNRVLLILVMLLAVWLGFQFWPQRKLVPSLAPVAAESKLNAVGLANNPDWDGLPQIFAIWADKAEWKDGRTRFAYWHPVMRTYSYYFEATRDGAGVHFMQIAEPHDPDYIWDESLGTDCPIRFYRPALAMVRNLPSVPDPGYVSKDLGPPEKPARPDQVKIPPVDLKLQPPIVESKR